MSSAYVLLLARWFVGLTFAWSSAAKLWRFSGFEAAVSDFGLVPSRWTRAVARIVVVVEALIAVAMLIGGPILSIGFVAAFALLSCLTLAILAVLRRKARVACNCFGASDRVLTRYDVARNVILLGVCVGGLVCSRASTAAIEPLVVAVLGVASAAFVVLVANLGDVVETLRRPITLDEELV